MPQFNPKSDKEIAAENLLPAGEYDFEIIGAENKRFSTGSEGIALRVGVYTSTGAQRFVNDNLIFQDNCMFKVSNFAKSVGLYDAYKAGNIDAQDCIGRSGKCKLKIEPEGDYPAKNSVASYVAPKAANAEPRRPQAQSVRVTPAPAAAGTVAANSDEDPIPF
jgi:hypothetical protein